MLSKNVKIAVLYNTLFLAFFLIIEVTYFRHHGDHTGQEIVGIPFYLSLFTVIHCGILLVSFFRTRKERFATYFINMLVIGGINFAAVFTDLLLIIWVLNLLD